LRLDPPAAVKQIDRDGLSRHIDINIDIDDDNDNDNDLGLPDILLCH
jgi:hypothetical protein